MGPARLRRRRHPAGARAGLRRRQRRQPAGRAARLPARPRCCSPRAATSGCSPRPPLVRVTALRRAALARAVDARDHRPGDHGRRRAGQRAGPRRRRPLRRRAAHPEPRRRHGRAWPTGSPRATRRSPTSWCGRRTPPPATRSRTPRSTPASRRGRRGRSASRLVGAIVDAGDDHVLNQGIVWDPETGAGDRYAKRHPVAYGEYIPLRSLLPDSLVTVGQLAGSRATCSAAAASTPLPSPGSQVADSICFDIAYDDGHRRPGRQRRRAARRADQQRQLHLHRPDRAAVRDHPGPRHRDRPYVVVAATNGVSGVIAPDGSVVDRTERRTQDVVVETVDLKPGHHPRASAWGEALRVATRPDAARVPAGPRRACGSAGRAAAPTAERSRRPAATAGPHEDAARRERRRVRVVMVLPTYDEAAQPRLDRRPAARGPARASTCSSSTTSRPTAPATIADALAAADPRVHVLHRTAKGGLGAAYLAGFAWALERGYDVIGEMDADGSHQPEQLHRLLDALPGRRPGDRLALGAGRPRRQLAAAPRAALARRQPLRPAAARHRRARRDRRLPALPPRAPWRRSTSTRSRSTGYVFQTDMVTPHPARRAGGARGADRVRRAGPRASRR